MRNSAWPCLHSLSPTLKRKKKQGKGKKKGSDDSDSDDVEVIKEWNSSSRGNNKEGRRNRDEPVEECKFVPCFDASL